MTRRRRWWLALRYPRRLRKLRTGMDLAAHEHWMDKIR